MRCNLQHAKLREEAMKDSSTWKKPKLSKEVMDYLAAEKRYHERKARNLQAVEVENKRKQKREESFNRRLQKAKALHAKKKNMGHRANQKNN